MISNKVGLLAIKKNKIDNQIIIFKRIIKKLI
jgi:hypothetical protein